MPRLLAARGEMELEGHAESFGVGTIVKERAVNHTAAASGTHLQCFSWFLVLCLTAAQFDFLLLLFSW